VREPHQSWGIGARRIGTPAGGRQEHATPIKSGSGRDRGRPRALRLPRAAAILAQSNRHSRTGSRKLGTARGKKRGQILRQERSGRGEQGQIESCVL
jgi:hypothetical protein